MLKSPKLNNFLFRNFEFLAVDLRSLALFRVCLGFGILWDLYLRLPDLVAFYSDFGCLPRSILTDRFESSPWQLCLHLMNGTWQAQMILFIVAAVFAVQLLIGYKTRLATVLSWLFLLSLQNRNPFILNSGNILFRMLLFWAMFMPLGVVCSRDLSRKGTAGVPASHKFVSMATVGLWVQIAMVYWFAIAHRHGADWKSEYTALYYALSVTQMVKPLGVFLLNFPEVLKVLTFTSYWLEILGPAILIFPLPFLPKSVWMKIRLIAVIVMIGFHINIFLMVDTGLFQWFMITALLSFIPSYFWDSVWPAINPASRSKDIAYIANQIFGRQPTPRLMKPSLDPGYYFDRVASSLTVNILALFFSLYTIMWNLAGDNIVVVPQKIRFIASLLRIDQTWQMFSSPIYDDGWYVIPGLLKNGKVVDVWKNGELDWKEPKNLYSRYKNEFWQKYMMLFARDNTEFERRLYFGKYVCRDWNTRHTMEDQKLERFDIVFMNRRTLPEGKRGELEKIVLWKHYCFEIPPEIEKDDPLLDFKAGTLQVVSSKKKLGDAIAIDPKGASARKQPAKGIDVKRPSSAPPRDPKKADDQKKSSTDIPAKS